MKIAIVSHEAAEVERLRLIFSGERDISVVAKFNSVNSALLFMADTPVDILLYCCDSFDGAFYNCTAAARNQNLHFDLMVYSSSCDRESVINAIRAGATGYILKESPPRELLEAVSDIYNGGAPLSPAVSRLVVSELSANGDCSAGVRLSRREKEILRSLNMGMTYKLIADHHNVSYHTVHAHIKNIYDKLGANNRDDALLRARKYNVI